MGEFDYDWVGVFGMGDGGNGEQCGECYIDKWFEYRCICVMVMMSFVMVCMGFVWEMGWVMVIV